MKIVIDDKIPYIRGAFEKVAEVVYCHGSQVSPELVKDADVLVTRTRTICDEQLLAGSSVKMIASATIGYDHIDIAYCERANIHWTNAPGCNSKSVEQYVLSALIAYSEAKKLSLENLCIGVVGVGNVGSKVAQSCRLLGMKVLLNDPPRQRAEEFSDFVSLDKLKEEADIISLHVPLNMQGDDKTFHLCNDDFFVSLHKEPLLINSCRGEVVDTSAVKKALKSKQISDFVCDCWENEPDIDNELLSLTCLATPHIAGYSRDGKAMGTQMTVRAISRFFGFGLDNWKAADIELPTSPVIEIDGSGKSFWQIISEVILHTYDIRKDDADFRSNPIDFEHLRDYYPIRREFPAFSIRLINANNQASIVLKQLGFSLIPD